MRLFAHVLDEERDAHVRAPLAEAVAPQAGRDDVDRLDVTQRALRLRQRLAHGVVGALRRAADQLDDLRDGHGANLPGPWERCTAAAPSAPGTASRRRRTTIR